MVVFALASFALLLHSTVAKSIADYDSKEVQELLVQWKLNQVFGHEVQLAIKCTRPFS